MRPVWRTFAILFFSPSAEKMSQTTKDWVIPCIVRLFVLVFVLCVFVSVCAIAVVARHPANTVQINSHKENYSKMSGTSA